MGNRVFVTGLAAVCGEANSIEDIWHSICTERQLSATTSSNEFLVEKAALGKSDAKILARHQIMALAVVEQAWTKAGLSKARNSLRGEGKTFRDERFGCFGGSALGGLTVLLEESASSKGVSPYGLSRWRGNAIGAVTGIRFGLGGANFSLNAASATGSQLLCLAGMCIQSGLMDAAVVVAADILPADYISRAMGANGSLTTDRKALPLSEGRKGMAPSEGAACIILESEKRVRLRETHPIMEWCGGGMANEAFHLLAPLPNGDVLCKLLHDAKKLAKDKIDWLSLHATGTSKFDLIETAAVAAVFGNERPWLSAFKRTTGHTLAAAGIIEAALLGTGFVTATVPPWPQNTDPALQLNFCRPTQFSAPKTALQIGQGMGGNVVVNLFRAV